MNILDLSVKIQFDNESELIDKIDLLKNDLPEKIIKLKRNNFCVLVGNYKGYDFPKVFDYKLSLSEKGYKIEDCQIEAIKKGGLAIETDGIDFGFDIWKQFKSKGIDCLYSPCINKGNLIGFHFVLRGV